MNRRVDLPRSAVGALVLPLLSVLACSGDGSDGGAAEREASPAFASDAGVATVLREHLARYPEMEIQDLYKLLHQAALGNAHATGDSVAARRRLEEEIAALQTQPTRRDGGPNEEPLAERITPGGELVRVNLRPYLAAEGDTEALWKAFLRTSRARAPSLDSLRVWWSEAERMAAEGELPFARDALRSFYVRQAVSGFSTGHHSSHYVEVYRPAYRVIAAAELRLP